MFDKLGFQFYLDTEKSAYSQLKHKNDPNLFSGKDAYHVYVNPEKFKMDTNYYLWILNKFLKF